MKNLLFLIALFAAPAGWISAQGIFNQKATKLRLSAQQIALIKTYYGYAKKGYKIVDKGLNTIHDIKNGELKLHKTRYDEMEQVNNSIQNYPLVKDSRELYTSMQSIYQTTWPKARQSGLLTQAEIGYLSGVYNRLLESAKNEVEEMGHVVENGYYKMTDDQRIRQIDKIYYKVQQKHKALLTLNSKVKLVTGKRADMKQSNRTLKNLYGQ